MRLTIRINKKQRQASGQREARAEVVYQTATKGGQLQREFSRIKSEK